MKKLLIIIILLSTVVSFPGNTFAQASEENIAQLNERIDDLKNRVASKVAELNLVEKRGIVGKVESISSTQITVNDINDKTRIIDVDEITKFDSTEGISEIKKGDTIGALGLYNKESERLLARFVEVRDIPLFLRGVITAKDEENFTITLVTVDGTTYIVDIERITKSYSFSEELEDAGFTNLIIHENAVVVGFEDPKEENRITASKIVTFFGIPKNPKIPVVDISPTAPPSTGSGVKLTPLGQ